MALTMRAAVACGETIDLSHSIRLHSNSMKKALHELKRSPWNTATVAHDIRKNDQAVFFRHGGTMPLPEERGPDSNRMVPPEGMPRPPLMVAIAAQRAAA
ncbi:TPA: hypothetical protein SAY52_004519 [Burkholderia cenocepacia]|uniref:hypothetical protein n=1 Tax=unclassified Burkholderia TaxID=2613784 RepID=UPI00158F415B|nr:MULTISPECIES: hypothetical protein [unclassified Burkholderia]HEF5873856.1 hypothetical protein [Burkholderia cenocepacia]